jgi:hypothetical protein
LGLRYLMASTYFLFKFPNFDWWLWKI